MRFLLFALIIIGIFVPSFAQDGIQPIQDSTRFSLLPNPMIQIESSEAVDAMYNFEFKKAHSHFNYLKKLYPEHPLPDLLMGLNCWWQIIPNPEVKKWDRLFMAYMDSTSRKAEILYKKHNALEGAFFLAASNAFSGRLHSERGRYTKAAWSGKRALKYLDKCRGHETYSPELLFGDALFNYYAAWIRDEYPLLRPLMGMFPRGDKKKGIKQLKQVANNAFYTRVEAQYYLMMILSSEYEDLEGALRVSKYLYEKYPKNAFFHRYYARLLYQNGRYDDIVTVSSALLDKVDNKVPGYEAQSGRYASFYLGEVKNMRSKTEEAKKYYERSVKFSEIAGATDMGYYFYSLLYLGEIAQKQGDKKTAKAYYKKVKKRAKRKHPAHKAARANLRKL